jgi:hypothetical protein
MILHCVFCAFREDTTEPAQEAVLSDLAAFSRSLEGVVRFDHGPNQDFEGKSAAYKAGFVIAFEDRGALQRYADHPTHKRLGAELCALCNGGADGIMVFDIETTPA